MSAFSLPVQRPAKRALVVGSTPGRAAAVAALRRLGCSCGEVDDAYAAMALLARQPHEFRMLILSLNSLYREELRLIAAAKERVAGLEVWLTEADGRAAALAEALSLGADGILSEDGFHRVAAPIAESATSAAAPAPARPVEPQPLAEQEHHHANGAESPHSDEPDPGLVDLGDPLLTAEELAALLDDEPARRDS